MFRKVIERDSTPRMEKLEALRMEMSTAGVDVVIVPTNDPHFCEMPPRHYARREFISGFTGSAGTAVITKDQALLWTDARYFLQAEVELSEQWSLMKSKDIKKHYKKRGISKNLLHRSPDKILLLFHTRWLGWCSHRSQLDCRYPPGRNSYRH